MKLPELIEESLTESDLREVLANLNLDHTGSKKELLEKVLNGIGGKSAKEVLSSFPSEVLIRICKEKSIKQDWQFFSDSNEQMVKKIRSKVLDTEPKFENDQSKKQIGLSHPVEEARQQSDSGAHAKPDTKATSLLRRANSNFEEVAKDIEEWLPKGNYISEDGYRDDLNPWLWSRRHQTTIRKGDSPVTVLVDNKYPIVMMVEPELSDFHRAFGLIHRHLEGFHSIIMVICRPKQDGELEFFEERVRRSLTYSKHPYKIIKKN